MLLAASNSRLASARRMPRSSGSAISPSRRMRSVSFGLCRRPMAVTPATAARSEEHTSELQSQFQHVCRLLLEKILNAWLGVRLQPVDMLWVVYFQSMELV